MRRGSIGAVLIVCAAAALPACASKDLDRRIAQLERDAVELTGERDDAQQELAESLRREDALARQAAVRDAELANVRTEYDDALARAQEYAAENKRLIEEAQAAVTEEKDDGLRLQELADKLRAESEPGTEVEITPDGNLEIRLPSDVTFAAGEAKLTKSGEQNLRSLAPAITGEYGAYEIRVVGHTDATPLKRTKKRWGSNRALGQARSRTVVEFLEDGLGIAPGRLTTASKGEYDPLTDNGTKQGRSKNRRVELIVVIPRQSALSLAK